MVNAAVIDDENTARSWIWVHLLDKAFQPEAKLFAIVPAFFDMAVDQAVGGESGEYGISGRAIRIMPRGIRKRIAPGPTHELATLTCTKPFERPTICPISRENIHSCFVCKHQIVCWVLAYFMLVDTPSRSGTFCCCPG